MARSARRFRRGLECLRNNQLELARAEFEASLRDDPDDAPAHFGLGCVYALKGSRDDAVREWIRCVEIDPEFGEAHYALAWAYYDAKDTEKGWGHTKKAMATGVRFDSIKDLIDRFTRTGQPISVVEQAQEISTRVSWWKHGHQLVFDLTCIFFVSLLCFLLLRGTLQNGYPRGYLDATMAFYIAKIKMLVRNNSLFTDSWYFGYEMLRYYPPLSTFIPLLIYRITGDLLASYYWLCLFFYAAFCVGVYIFTSRLLDSRMAGLFSGSLWALTHVNFISFQGHYWETCRLMGTAAVPWVLFLIHRTLEKGQKRDLLLSIGLASYCLLSNLFSAIDLVLLAAPYILLNLSPSGPWGEDRIRREIVGKAVLVSFLFGVPGLSLWWYVPSVIPHGLGAYFTGSSGFTPPLIDTFFRLFPPGYMPALQLPLTILGLMGIALAIFDRSKVGGLLAVWLAASFVMAYIVRIQSSRVVLIFGLCFALGAGYLIKGTQRRLDLRGGSLFQYAVLTAGVLVLVVLLSLQYLPRYHAMAVVDDTYLSSDEYIVSTWLSENIDGFRAYLMWGSWFRGSQWVNTFYPEVRQVLGGYDQGARVETDAPFIFDSLVKWGEDAAELGSLAKTYHVKYIVVDEKFMESQGVGIEKFKDERVFKPVEDLNSRLRYAVVYEVNDVSPLDENALSVNYHYWDNWRYLGTAASFVMLILFLGFLLRLKLIGDDLN